MSDGEQGVELFDLGDEYSGNGARALAAGNTAEGHDFFRQAIAAYRAALKAAPKEDVVLRSNLHLCIGAREFGLGDLETATATYESVLAALTNRPELTKEGEGKEVLIQARLNLAEVSLATGQVEKALGVVDAVLLEQPDHPFAEYLKSRCEAAPGDPAN